MSLNQTYPQRWCLRTRIGDYAIWADSKGVYVQKDYAAHIFICWKDLGALQAAAFAEHLGENGELRAFHVAAEMIARKTADKRA